MRQTWFIIGIVLALHASAFARGNPPVNQFLGSDAVLSTYYDEYLESYGSNYRNELDAFRAFCRTLRTSDLLTEEMILVGLPVDQVAEFLQVLEASEFKSGNEATEEAMLVIDFALESLGEYYSNMQHREFRREVLAQIPPMTQTG